MLKRTKLRRKSKDPIKKLKDKADRSLQDWYRWKYPNKKCERCGSPFRLMHHHIEKSKSNYGRYHKDNLIFLCKYCHDNIHFGNHNVVSIYTLGRGKKWEEKIMAILNHPKITLTIKYLNEIIKKYEV